MEIITQKPQEKRENFSPTYSPNSTSSSSCINGSSVQVPTPPLTPKPVSRSDVNPYPTTFVQADTSTFKQVVQMLTGSGSSETAKIAADPPHPHPHPNKLSSSSSSSSIPPIKSTGQKKQGFKLYERRNSLKNGFIISPLIPASPAASATVGFSPRNRQAEILSPSILDFPSLVLSPVTPLNEDPFYNNNNNNYYNSSSSSPSMAGANSSEEEEKAIAEKKFYLHPSPRTATPRNSEPPQLLPLFPVTSPRVSDTTTSSSSS